MKMLPLLSALALFSSACAESSRSPATPLPDGGRAEQGQGAPDLASHPAADGSTTPLPGGGSARDGAAEVLGKDAGASAGKPDGALPSSDASTPRVDASQPSPEVPNTPAPLPKQGVVVGYYPAWATYTRDYQVSEVPAAKLTHINYAFANIQAGRCVLGDAWADVQKTFPGDNWDESSANKAGNLKQLRKLKTINPNLRTLISVGGWTWSGGFSDVALTDESRRLFASSCVDFMVEHGFDGIDIDWEFPVGGGLEGNKVRPEDKANYTLLLRALRSALNARQQTEARTEPYLLTIAAPAGPTIVPNLEARAISEVVDWINVMSYDFHGGWEKRSGHNAPLKQATGDTAVGYNVASAIDSYLAAGVPPARLVMGVPFYGRSFAGVSAGGSNGVHQPSTGAGPGTWENGILDYHDIVAKYLSGARYTRYVDESASVPYLYNATASVWISYDDPESLRKKRAFIVDKKLAGSMIWDLSSDTADGVLIDALTK